MVRFEFNSKDIENFYNICSFYLYNATRLKKKEERMLMLFQVKDLAVKGYTYAHTTEMQLKFKELMNRIKSWLDE